MTSEAPVLLSQEQASFITVFLNSCSIDTAHWKSVWGRARQGIALFSSIPDIYIPDVNCKLLPLLPQFWEPSLSLGTAKCPTGRNCYPSPWQLLALQHIVKVEVILRGS